MLPVEIVVRGYLSGSGWKDYVRTGAVCGHVLPAGLGSRSACPIRSSRPRRRRSRATTRTSTPRPPSGSSAPSAGRRRSCRARSLPPCGRARRDTGDHPRRHEVRARRRSRWHARARRRGADARLLSFLARRLPTLREAHSRPTTSSTSATTPRASAGTRPTPARRSRRRRRGHARALRRGVRIVDGARVRRLPRRPAGRAPMRVTVLVSPKQGILDPQGEAVQGSLRKLGFAVGGARVGRLVDLEVDAPSRRRPRPRWSGCARSCSRTR